MEDDFLDEIIAEGTKRNSDFPRLVDEAQRRRADRRRASTEGMWMIIRVELTTGMGRDFEPAPGRDFLVSSQHTFRQLADAINAAFARWDLAHLHVFQIGERMIGTEGEDLDIENDLEASFDRHDKGEVFSFEFDFGDAWEHRCTVIESPVELGAIEDESSPIVVFGWGTIPDQYGRDTPALSKGRTHD